MNVHKLMHQLCLRAGKEVNINDTMHWLIHANDLTNFICLYCNDKIFILDVEKHAFSHIREHNLLAFL